MSDETGDDRLEEIMGDFDSEIIQQDEDADEAETSANKRELSEEELEEFSKEDIADEYDFRFGKTPDGRTQHLLPANENSTYCTVAFRDSFRISDEPGPYDPICSSCKSSALGAVGSDLRGGFSPEKTKENLMQWLADEVDGVDEPTFSQNNTLKALRKDELAAIVSHIQSLKEMQPFEKSWDEITQFAETAERVETIYHGNRNDIEVINGAIVVRNLNTETRRRISKSDFEYAYRLLEKEEELTLDALEPELAGEKSILLAILAEALELKTKKRPVTVYANDPH